MSRIDAIIAQLRVPDLPYPVGRQKDEDEPLWGTILSENWLQQVDSTVIQLLQAREDRWSSRQVNAAYLADRIMDVFLRTSGLHYSLVVRVARLRFYLAWQFHREGESAVAGQAPLRLWLDHLAVFRGWSDGAGRSARHLLQRLDDLIPVVSQAMQQGIPSLMDECLHSWLREDNRQGERVELLHKRLLETEQGAARQRAADLGSANRVAKALDGRRLPTPIVQLIEEHWQVLLRQVALTAGLHSEPWKKATRVLDWLVWAMDPALSDKNRDRLYQVGEELLDRVSGIWTETFGTGLPAGVAEPLQQHLVARLRGESLEFSSLGPRQHDDYWLQSPSIPQAVADCLGQWLVSGEGIAEQRRWLFAYFDISGEVLWTNGQGVKQGIETAESVGRALENRDLQPLPDPQSFERVLDATLTGLTRVLDAQQAQRRIASDRAEAEAERLREAREAVAAQAQADAEAQRIRDAEAKAACERALQEAEDIRREEENVRLYKEREDRRAELQEQVDRLHLGAWVEITQGETATKLKLAVRINASGKLVFVDRLGLNKREVNRQELATLLLDNQARILHRGAEFEDTLSRVVGRIRVGR